MKYRGQICAVTMIALVMLCLSVPIQAQEDDAPHLVYVGGIVEVEPMSSFVFNWTWWGLDEGISLSFFYTTNDPSQPVYCSVNNTKYTMIDIYDYFFLYQWNSTDFPARAELWWFTFTNIINTTITIEVALNYAVQDPEQGLDVFVIFFVMEIVTLGAFFILGAVHYVRNERRRIKPERKVCI